MAEVVTGEAVVLDLSVARFPSRIAALLLDVIVQIPVLIVVELVVFQTAARNLNTASAAAVLLSGLVLTWIGYPLIFETLSRGKTLGKMALGIRVVSDDGSPVRFRQALIRALSLTFIELWLPPITLIGIPAGLITSMATAQGKRLGDLFAGTFVIQERVPRRPELAPVFTVVPPELAGWAQHLELSRLSDQTAAAASSYLRRFYQLLPAAREQLGFQLAAAVAAQVSPPPPPGTPPAAYLAAVLAVRREREQARMHARLTSHATAAGQLLAAGGPQAAPPPGTLPYSSPAIDSGEHSQAGGQGQAGAQPEASVHPRAGQPAGPPKAPADEQTVSLNKPGPPSGTPPEDFGFTAPF